jgi:6-phosphogluconolactonase (cycloisomerase 2 family)
MSVLRAVGVLVLFAVQAVGSAAPPPTQFFYVTTGGFGGSSVAFAAFALDTATGAIRENGRGGATTPTVCCGQQLALHPSGRFAYLVGADSTQVAVYHIDPSTGRPSFGSGLDGPACCSAAVDPTGRFLYVANLPGWPVWVPGIYTYSIDPASGALTLLAGPVSTGRLIAKLHFHPTRPWLYAATETGVELYTMDEGGALALSSYTEISGETRNFALDPYGRFLFAAPANRVVSYAVSAADGTLTIASDAAAPGGHLDLAVSPRGDLLYVSGEKVEGFRVSRANGALARLSASPFEFPRLPRTIGIDLTGRRAIVFEAQGAYGYITVHTVEPGTRSLVPTGLPPVAADTFPGHPTFLGARVSGPEPWVSVVESAVNENVGVARFEIELPAPLNAATTLLWSTVPGTALAPADFQSVSGSVVVPPGVTTVSVTGVPITNDVRDEPTKWLTIHLTTADGTPIPDASRAMAILDDDRSPACQSITTLPFTVSAQGRYCLATNLSTAITSGAAITIDADFVELDLRGLKIGGGSAGLATQAYGIYAKDRTNLTIRGGNIRGFRRGIFLEDSGNLVSRGHLVSGVRLDGNTEAGIWVQGWNVIVRGNHVLDTTGSTLPAVSDTFGICVQGPVARILNNDVSDTVGVGGGQGTGILVAALASVIENNRVAGRPGLIDSPQGIHIEWGTDALVVGNRLSTLTEGISFEVGAAGKYRGNVTSGVTTPYSGGTDAGNNQ